MTNIDFSYMQGCLHAIFPVHDCVLIDLIRPVVLFKLFVNHCKVQRVYVWDVYIGTHVVSLIYVK